MNWPLVIRNVCEAYGKTPQEVMQNSLDQIYVMAMPRKVLGDAQPARVEKVAPASLVIDGKLAGTGESWVQRMKREAEEEKAK